MEVLTASITISENSARTASISYRAPSSVDLDSFLGKPLVYIYSAGTSSNSGGATLFNGVVLSSSYDPKSDSITLKGSDLRKVVLGNLSNDQIDALIPTVINPQLDDDIVGYERVSKRLAISPGHVDLNSNRKPRYTPFSGSGGNISVDLNSALCVSSQGGNSSSGGSPINETTIAVEYSYQVQRERKLSFKWTAPQNYFKRVIASDLRLPTWDAVTESLKSVDCVLTGIGARFLPDAGLVQMFTGADVSASGAGPGSGNWLHLGDPFLKRVSAASATLSDKWEQTVTEKFNVKLTASSSLTLGVSRKQVNLSFTTENPNENNRESEGLDTNLIAPEQGSANNPDVAGTYANGKTSRNYSNNWNSIASGETGETITSTADYIALKNKIEEAVEKERLNMLKSHRIGRSNVTTIINPGADITKTLTGSLGKVSLNGKIGSITFNINHERDEAQMTCQVFSSIASGGSDSFTQETQPLNLELLPKDNVNLNLQGGNNLFVGNDFSGLNGSSFSGGDGFTLARLEKENNNSNPQRPNTEPGPFGNGQRPKSENKKIRERIQDKMDSRHGKCTIHRTAESSFRFCVSPPDVSDESSGRFEVVRLDADQNLTIKV